MIFCYFFLQFHFLWVVLGPLISNFAALSVRLSLVSHELGDVGLINTYYRVTENAQTSKKTLFPKLKLTKDLN